MNGYCFGSHDIIQCPIMLPCGCQPGRDLSHHNGNVLCGSSILQSHFRGQAFTPVLFMDQRRLQIIMDGNFLFYCVLLRGTLPGPQCPIFLSVCWLRPTGLHNECLVCRGACPPSRTSSLLKAVIVQKWHACCTCTRCHTDWALSRIQQG